MGFKVAKCPSCGGDLNVETDRDVIFCMYCGAKIQNSDQKIVVEHITRRVDEAEILKAELERERRASRDEMGRRLGIVEVCGGAIGTIASFFLSEFGSGIRVFAVLIMFCGFAMIAMSGAKKKK